MFSYQNYFDASFHHTCLIVPEEDVLTVDIAGSGCFNYIRRWWHDLFLLSYHTPRDLGLYTSSHVMRTERFRQYRKYHNRIHPLSKFRNFWDFIILHALIINKIIFRYTSSFIYEDLSMFYFYVGVVCEIIFVLDLYVSLKTGYIDYEAKAVVLDSKECAIKFCSTKLFLYVASAIPLHCLMLLRYGSEVHCGLCKANTFISALKVLSVFSIIRLYDASDYWIKNCTRWVYFFRYLRIWLIGLASVFQVFEFHDAICLAEFIRTNYVIMKSALGYMTFLKFYLEIENYKIMALDLYRMLRSLIIFNVGNYIQTEYYLDKLATFVVYVIAKFTYGWAILEFYSLISQSTYSTDQVCNVKKNAEQIVKYYQLPNKLGEKIDDYFRIRPIGAIITEKHNGLYKSLPEVIKVEIKLRCYLRLLMRLPLFRHWPVPVITELVLILQRKIYMYNDILMLPYVNGEGLLIVDEGVLAVYTEDYQEVGHLIDGDYFGELSLVTDKELCASCVVSITPSTVLLLDKMQFRQVMTEYPKLFKEFKQELKAKALKPKASKPAASVPQ